MKTIDFKEVQGFRTWWAWAGVAAINALFIYAIVQQVILKVPFGTKPAPDLVLLIIELFFFAAFHLPVFCKIKNPHYQYRYLLPLLPFSVYRNCH